MEPTGVPWEDREAVYRTDMRLCEPRTRITREFRRGGWKAIDYETEAFKGTMLYSIPGLGSHALSYPLKLRGWYSIYLGQHDSFQRYRLPGHGASVFAPSPILKAKLSGEEVFTYIVPENPHPFGSEHKQFSSEELTETFWQAADLTGQDILFEATDISDANISYVKLVPLTPKEVSYLLMDRGRQDTRRLMSVFDASSMRAWRSRDWILSQLAALRTSDVGIVLWGTSVGFACFYPTKVGEPPQKRATPEIYPGNECLFDIQVRGKPINPLREAIDYGHKLGLQVYASIRLEGPLAPPDDENTGEFYNSHPQYLCRSRQGYPLPHLSLVYPAVRQKWIELLREQIRYGADGANFVFVRGWPFVGYDGPALRRFKREHGVHPRELDEQDERWLRCCALYITQFLRDIRRMLDEEARRLGRAHLGTAYHVPGSPKDSLHLGLDVKTWIDEKLVDFLVVQARHPDSEHPEWAFVKAIQSFKPLVKNSGCQLYANLFPRTMAAEILLKKALASFNAGADGLALWDTDGRVIRVGEWAMTKKLGHRAELKNWKCDPTRYFRVLPLKSLGGRVFDKFFQTNG